MSLTLTEPVESVIVRFVALTDPPVAKSMPVEPAISVVVVAFMVPAPVIPLAALEALRVKAVPELLLTVTTPALTSLMMTEPPVELAWREPALVESIWMPPAAAVAVSEAVLRPVARLVEVTLPLTADSTMEPAAL